MSEFASWSVKHYSKIISAALAAAGAPPDLVQFVVGYGDAGNALVTGGVDKVIFVGSTVVGERPAVLCMLTGYMMRRAARSTQRCARHVVSRLDLDDGRMIPACADD